MKRIFILFTLIIISINLYAQDNLSSIEEYFDVLIASKFRKIYASSFLVEKGLPKNYYAPEKAFDGNINTAWVEGVEGDGIGEYILFYIPIKNSRYDKKPAKISLSIINGYAKNESLFKLNNRVKEFCLEIYEAPVGGMANGSSGGEHIFFRLNRVILSYKENFILEDNRGKQLFEILFKSKHIPTPREVFYECIGKIKIISVYPGKKTKDTCISEISVSGTTEY